MSKLAKYLEQVSVEDAEMEVELTEEEQAIAQVVEENELEVAEVDMEVTPEAVEETAEAAEVAMDEIKEIRDETEELDNAADEAEEETASIEQFQTVLAHGLRTKTYSPQFVAIVQHKLEQLSHLSPSVETPSLENYGGENLEDFYKVSIESFNGFVKRINDALQSGSRNLAKKINTFNAGSGVDDAVNNTIAKADLVIKGEAKDEPAVIKGRHAAGDHHLKGSFDGSILKSLQHDAKMASDLLNKFLPAAFKYTAELIEVLEEAVKEGGVGKTDAIVSKAVDIKTPVSLVPEAMFSQGMGGGFFFVSEQVEGTDLRSKLKALGKTALPKVDGMYFKGTAEDVTIDKPTADKIARQAKINLTLAKKIKDSFAMQLVKDMDKQIDVIKRVRSGANATSWSENKNMNILGAQLPHVIRKTSDAHWVVLHTLIDNAQCAVDYAAKAVKTTD